MSMQDILAKDRETARRQIAYLERWSWCQNAQDKIMGGYVPTKEQADEWEADNARNEHRDRMKAKYGDGQ